MKIKLSLFFLLFTQFVQNSEISNLEYSKLATSNKIDKQLVAAAKAGNLELVQILVEAGADIDACEDDEYGHSNLHWAAIKGYYDMALYLIKKGANVNIKNKKYGTPLTSSIYNGHDYISFLLINNGADINSPCDKNFTPLMLAVKRTCRIVDALIESGADINAQNDLGDTAFHIAARAGSNIVLNKLIYSGRINPNIKNKKGETFLDCAKAKEVNKKEWDSYNKTLSLLRAQMGDYIKEVSDLPEDIISLVKDYINH